MEIDLIIWIAGGAAFVIIFLVVILLFNRMRQADLTSPPAPGETPPWIDSPPPLETVEATRADGKEGRQWDHTPGEGVAAPFAEQIEDIVTARIKKDPALSQVRFDVGTTADGMLEFVVDGQAYYDVADLPNERLRQVVQEAVADWNRRA
jgi:hypothetical protein